MTLVTAVDLYLDIGIPNNIKKVSNMAVTVPRDPGLLHPVMESTDVRRARRSPGHGRPSGDVWYGVPSA